MKKALSIAFVFLALVAQAQTLFTASADRYKVGVGETFTVTFKINANAGSFSYPNFQGFSVVRGPMTSHSSSFINGTSSVETAATFDLIALKKGEFTIESASVKAGGTVYKTKPLKISVGEASERKAGSMEDKAASLAYVKILTNKRKLFVGEPISVRYILVLKSNVGNFDYLAEPEFQGFIKNDIELTNIQTQREKINGQTETTADISQFILIPQQAGNYDLGDLKLRLPTQVPTGRRDWFGQQELQTVNQVSSSSFPKLEVLPLPQAGKPHDFSGGVGSYKLEVNLSRTEVKGNESVTLTVQITGKGNIQLIELPTPEIPNSIESYDPKYKENISVLPTGVKGYKRNEILLIPRYKGVYKIPPMHFSFFDPDSEQYIELKSDALEINVTEGEERKNVPGSTAPNSTDKNAVSAIGEDILFIHTQPSAFVKKTESFFSSRIHWILAGLFLGLSFILFVIQRLRNQYKPDLAKKAKKQAGGAAKKQLKVAHKKLQENDVKAFYSELSTALQHYFQGKANLEPSQFNTENVTALIAKRGGDSELQKQVAHLINQANMARFAPLTEANMKSDYELARTSLERLEDLL